MRNSSSNNDVVTSGAAASQRRSLRTTVRTLCGWGLTAAFLSAVGVSAWSSGGPGENEKPKRSQPATAPSGEMVAGLSPADAKVLSDRFAKEVWPILVEDCASCHGEKNASQFLLAKTPQAAFLQMLGEGQFDEDNHASIVQRVTTTDKMIVMPPPSMGEMKRAKIAVVEKFAEDLLSKRKVGVGMKADEAFPPHLMMAFGGKPKNTGPDNTFVSFRQLRGKVKTIFGDDWVRDDRNQFVENVHLFQGADFVKRFDESTKPAATFLTGVDLMARDVASQAFLTRTGPFAGFPENLPSPVGMKAPSPAYKTAINHLYNRLLFRNATAVEMTQAFSLIQGVYRQKNKLTETAPQDVRFALTVKDSAGMAVTQDVNVRVSAPTPGQSLYQEFVDQSKDAAEEAKKTATYTLAQPLALLPAKSGQKVMLTNAQTHGNVSISSVTLRGPLPEKTEKVISVEDNVVRPEGAWRIKKDDGFTSYEDNNENKGSSHITFPLSVEKPGKYEVAVTWRRFKAPPFKPGQKGKAKGAPLNGAPNVLVEVVSAEPKSRLAVPAAPAVPPKGEAHFTIDQTLDTVPYADLKTAFQFGEGAREGVEIRNDNTRKQVVADAVKLLPPLLPGVQDTGVETDTVILRGASVAVGREQWVTFKDGTFKAYNSVGPNQFSDTDAKGDKRPNLGLLYRPALAKSEGFTPAKFYRVGIVYPGRVDNETNVPVIVRAKASSPIVRIAYPYHAFVGAPVSADASSTYNLQRTPLKFTWKQIGGPRVKIANPASPKIAFVAPGMTPQQGAWEGLCRALMSHPDFLFTRPRSLVLITEAKQKRRLQLVKIAQDLVSRPPTVAEIAKVDAGAPLSTLVDGYLKSPEFKDFYFHRVRLYLESHGSTEEDEPARLWTYLAMNDRSFKEILTADYTIDTAWKKAARPPYHGKTGVLTMKGFIKGKPGLPHFNYSAQVLEKFMGYVFEVPDAVLQVRDGITASATTDPNSMCYTCHKVLTPLAYQRMHWNDDGMYVAHDETNLATDDSDRSLVASYPFKGNGLEAFAVQAQNKERFIRTILQNHFVWYFGRELRFDTDERGLYKRLWDNTAKNNYAIRPLIRAIILSPEYLNGLSKTPPANPGGLPADKKSRLVRLERLHRMAKTLPMLEETKR